APATNADGFDHLRDWLERGFAGTMDYMHRHGEARRHPCSILPEVRSVLMVAMNYRPDGERGCVSAPSAADTSAGALGALTQPRSPAGRIARYARGQDYHDVL